MNAGKHTEADSLPPHKVEGRPPSETTALQNFSNKCHGGQVDATSDTKAEKVAPEKFFLDRLSDISLKADSGFDSNMKSNQASAAAWNKLFNPTGFNSTDKDEPSLVETLCLQAKIYGDKA